MPTIVIELVAERLDNPDLDLRYEIPDVLVARAPGLLASLGYDYAEDDEMQIFFETTDLARAVPIVLALLEHDRLHGNHLALAATVGVSELSIDEATAWRVVSPAARVGEMLRRYDRDR